jgi:hypothetical protein
MTALAPDLTAFLREHLPTERRASSHTCDMLVCFAAHRLRLLFADYRDCYEVRTGRSLREFPHCRPHGIMVVIDCIARSKVCLPGPDTS